MKEFFLNLLNNLDKLAGLKQLEKIYAVHGDDEEAAKNEINVLLKVLCNVSKQFPEIPEYDQQKIITQAVITATREEFPSLNGNVLYRWLNPHRSRYFKQDHHRQETKISEEALTGEARDRMYDEWMKSLASPGQMIISRVKVDAEKEGKVWASEIERKAIKASDIPNRHAYTVEEIKQRNERIRAMQEKAFREKNPQASEEEVKLFLESVKQYEVKIPK